RRGAAIKRTPGSGVDRDGEANLKDARSSVKTGGRKQSFLAACGTRQCRCLQCRVPDRVAQPNFTDRKEIS
ncbi:MAG: hypothetical protein ACXWUS_19770, partial [Burkholderiales bacterium]